MAQIGEPHIAAHSRVLTDSGQPLGFKEVSALDGSRTLAGMLLAAAMAALLAVADQIISTWTDGHLLAAWVALWTVVFATLALLAPPLRQMAAFGSAKICAQVANWRSLRGEARG